MVVGCGGGGVWWWWWGVVVVGCGGGCGSIIHTVQCGFVRKSTPSGKHTLLSCNASFSHILQRGTQRQMRQVQCAVLTSKQEILDEM